MTRPAAASGSARVQAAPDIEKHWTEAFQKISGLTAGEVRSAEILERLSLAGIRDRVEGKKRPFIGLAGAGAVGKGTFTRAFLEKTPMSSILLKTTTRSKRPTETDLADYEFVTEAVFEESRRGGRYWYTRAIQGRGKYAVSVERLQLGLASEGALLFEESPLDLNHLVPGACGPFNRFFLLVYLLAPTPTGATLADRFATRAPAANNNPLRQLEREGTLGGSQAREFLDAFHLYRNGAPVVFLVNDNIDRVIECIRVLLASLQTKEGL
jgi:hypothetical protein